MKKQTKNSDKLNEYEKNETKISNISRFNVFTNIYNKINKENDIYESDYVFSPYIFKKINKKGINNLIYKLKLFCNKKYSLEEIKNNTFLEVDTDDGIDDYSSFIQTCIYCSGTEVIDETNGTCNTCKNNMNKKEDYHYSSDYE